MPNPSFLSVRYEEAADIMKDFLCAYPPTSVTMDQDCLVITKRDDGDRQLFLYDSVPLFSVMREPWTNKGKKHRSTVLLGGRLSPSLERIFCDQTSWLALALSRTCLIVPDPCAEEGESPGLYGSDLHPFSCYAGQRLSGGGVWTSDVHVIQLQRVQQARPSYDCVIQDATRIILDFINVCVRRGVGL